MGFCPRYSKRVLPAKVFTLSVTVILWPTFAFFTVKTLTSHAWESALTGVRKRLASGFRPRGIEAFSTCKAEFAVHLSLDRVGHHAQCPGLAYLPVLAMALHCNLAIADPPCGPEEDMQFNKRRCEIQLRACCVCRETNAVLVFPRADAKGLRAGESREKCPAFSVSGPAKPTTA